MSLLWAYNRHLLIYETTPVTLIYSQRISGWKYLCIQDISCPVSSAIYIQGVGCRKFENQNIRESHIFLIRSYHTIARTKTQRIRTKTCFDQFCIRFIRIYRLLWSSARVRNEILTNHRRDIKTQGEGRWTRQGWIYLMFDVIRHIFIIPLQNQRNSKGEKLLTWTPAPGRSYCRSWF